MVIRRLFSCASICIIESVGGLSERWFMYAEDMEWCRRIINGWMDTLLLFQRLKLSIGLAPARTKMRKLRLCGFRATEVTIYSLKTQADLSCYYLIRIMILGLFSRVLLYLLRGLID